MLVAGGTGKTGHHIVKELLASGYPVRIITRSKDGAKKVFGEEITNKLELFECNVDNVIKSTSN